MSMTIHFETIPTAVFAAVLLCWLIFASVFIFRKRPPRPAERKRDRTSILGMALQGVGFALVWSVRRPAFTPLAPMSRPLEVALAFLTVALAVGSIWITAIAVRALGKQWAFAARLVSDHKLVTEGPYRLIRHPIYTSMLGMLMATGLALSLPVALAGALVFYAIGTVVRVRSEEKLLREAFGPEFEAYARRVPAVFPRLF